MDSKDLMENYTEKYRLTLLLKEDALNKKYIATLGKSIQNLLKKYGEIEGAMPKLAEESSKNISALEKDLQKMSGNIDKNISKLLSASTSSSQSIKSLERKTQNLVTDFTKSTETLANEMSIMKKIVDTFSMVNVKELKDGKDGTDGKGIADAYMDMGHLKLKFTDDSIKDLGKIGSSNDEIGRIKKGGRGETGVGIQSIARTSGDGSAGTTDTYTITFTDASVTPTTYQVYNGKDGAQQVIDNLTSTSATDALSAKQGKALNDLVSTNKTEITNALNVRNPKNIFDQSIVVYGEVQTNGTILNEGVPTSAYYTSDFIKVDVGKTVYLSRLNTGVRAVQDCLRFVAYNSNKVAIGNSATWATSYLIPAGATYVRFSFNKTYISYQLQLEYYGMSHIYEAYYTPYYVVEQPLKPTIVESVAHQGYAVVAPNNTIPAVQEASRNGFKWTESDLKWTSDGVPVMCHNDVVYAYETGKLINPILMDSTGVFTTAVTISAQTLATLQTYDWGKWKSGAYLGVTIPTFDEFIKNCKRYGMKAFVDNVSGSQAQINALMAIVKKYGMQDNVAWSVGFATATGGYVLEAYNEATLIASIATYEDVSIAVASVKATYPNCTLILSVATTGITIANVETFRSSNIDAKLCVWTINDSTTCEVWLPYADMIVSSININDIVW